MAIVGFEAIAVVAILLILFLWGPKKLPEIARSIGLAKREFEKAGKEISSVTTPLAPPVTSTGSSEEPIIVAARALGITTEGKTKEALAKEIAERANRPS